MKKLLLYFLLLSAIVLQAQLATDAPWMQTNAQARVTNPTLSELHASFDQYWENHDKDKKGSGYKPFKRWEQFWSSQLDSSGHLMTREAIWQAWQQKQAMQNTTTNRSAATATSNWTSIGPYSHNNSSSWSPGQGRVNFAIIDPNNANTYYVGTPAGGIWKSTDAGQSWTAKSDDLPQLGVSGIAIDPNNSNTIYIATGDDDAGDTYSIGVMKSTDGGTTWNTTGLVFNTTYNRSNDIYINPNDSNMLWVATDDGIYKTTDAGVNWTLVLAGNCKDLKLKPNSPDTIYAALNNTFYRSTDFGETFTAITSAGMPTNTSRMAIAVTPADNTVVYLLNAANSNFEGVYKSTDSGANFTKTLETDDIFESDQSWYDMAITVSDTNVNTVFVGVLNIWKSTDGGDNFIALNNWSSPNTSSYTHADIHFLRYYNGVLFAGTDGGIYRSTDDGANFTDLTVNGLAIGEFYRVSVSKDVNNHVVGGLQDNGGFGYNNGSWGVYHGADGMDCAVDPNNPNTYYGFIQSGLTLYTTQDGGASGASYASPPSGVTGNWITPLVANKQSVLYAGYNKLYKIENQTFIAVSGADFGGKIENIEVDPLDNAIIYVSKDSNLFKSTDSGVSFTNIHTFTNAISSIEVNNLDSNTIYISTYGTSGKVYKTTDNAATWIDITYNLPADSKNVVRHQNHHSDNPIYVGTSLGVYYLDDTNPTTWQVFDTNLPNVSVSDLEINSYNHTITAATYGRGVWQSPISSEVASDDVKNNKIIAPNKIISCGTTVTPNVEVFNNGQNNINQIDFTYNYDNDASQSFQWNGTLTAGQTIAIALPSQSLNIGDHELQVSSTIANDAYVDNNSGYSTFIINRSDVPTTLFSFEDSTTDTFMTTGAAWQIASPASANLNTVSSGTKAYCIGATADYLPGTHAYLYSPCYDLTTITSPILNFKMAFRTELDWDYLYMEFSTDGNNWQILGNASDPNWYNSATTANGLPGKQWTGIADTLQLYSYDLEDFTTTTSIQFRFVFLSDSYVNEQGVVIDDFTISGTLGVANSIENTITIKPNPSNGVFALSWNSNTAIKNLQVYTITGQLVKTITHSFQGNNYNLDMNELSKGMYLLKVKSDQGQFTKKILLK